MAVVVVALGAIAGVGSVAVAPHRSNIETQSSVRSLAPAKAELLFVGDVMLDRYIRVRLGTHGADHVFGGVAPLLTSVDMVVANLEGPVTSFPSVSVGSRVGELTNMRFTFALNTTDILKQYNIGIVSIGNNHIRDFGDEGVLQTIGFLQAADMAFVGDPSGRANEPEYRTIEGIRFAFVSYNDFRAGDAARATQAIKNAKTSGEADVVIVLPHWGNEYEVEPPERVRELAHAFVTAGADLIIGSHSHVVGEVEDWQGTRIYYSLGNFVFDQYFNAEVSCGRAVRAVFTKTATGVYTTFENIPVGMHRDGSTQMGCPGI